VATDEVYTSWLLPSSIFILVVTTTGVFFFFPEKKKQKTSPASTKQLKTFSWTLLSLNSSLRASDSNSAAIPRTVFYTLFFEMPDLCPSGCKSRKRKQSLTKHTKLHFFTKQHHPLLPLYSLFLKISTTLSAVLPSQRFGIFLCCCLLLPLTMSNADLTISSVSNFTSLLVPSVIVTGRSVLGRRVRQGTPK